MHRAPLGCRIGNKSRQPRKRVGLPHPDGRRLLCHAFLRTHPDDVVHVDIVSKNHLSAAVDVHHRRQVRQIQPEIVQKCAVLTEDVGVVGIVGRGVVVAQKNEDSAADACCELLAARDIGFFAKHDVYHNLSLKYIKFVAQNTFTPLL